MATSSPFLSRLRADLGAQIEGEMDTTARVAVYKAAGYSGTSIASLLGIEDIELKMALHRLRGIADGW